MPPLNLEDYRKRAALPTVATASLIGPEGGVTPDRIRFAAPDVPMVSARFATGLHPIGTTLLAIFGPIAAIPSVLGMLRIARGTLLLALFGPSGYACE